MLNSLLLPYLDNRGENDLNGGFGPSSKFCIVKHRYFHMILVEQFSFKYMNNKKISVF